MYQILLINAPHLSGLASSPPAFPQCLSHSARLDLPALVICLLVASCKDGWDSHPVDEWSRRCQRPWPSRELTPWIVSYPVSSGKLGRSRIFHPTRDFLVRQSSAAAIGNSPLHSSRDGRFISSGLNRRTWTWGCRTSSIRRQRRQDQPLRSCVCFMDGRGASCHRQAICYGVKWVIFIALCPWTLSPDRASWVRRNGAQPF